MTEITRVQLENEMDLILAHKQAMKLAELCGLSLPAQTTLATAVSELGRIPLEGNSRAAVVLHVSDKGELPKLIIVQVRFDQADGLNEASDGFRHARKLVRNTRIVRERGEAIAELYFGIPSTTRIDAEATDRWRRYMNTDPAVSPYEEIKRKNRQLQELANKLRDSEQQYKELTDSLPLVIFTVDAEGNALFINRWLTEYCGQTLEEINGTKWTSVFDSEHYPEVAENFSRLASGGFKKDMEYRLRNAGSGEYRWHMGTITPVKGDDGAVAYWSVFMADIHAQKEVEAMLKDNRDLREMKALLEEKVSALDVSNKQLEQFAYVASHDLQEPLRKIVHFSDYLNKRFAVEMPDEAQDVLRRIGSATHRMRALINDVLAYSVLPKVNTQWETVSLAFVLREVLAENELRIAELGAVVHAEKLPAIRGNAAQLRQLVGNIISNSLKYSDPSRPLEIRITCEVHDGILMLRFEDNGIGFESQYVPKIFELFQRLHGRDKYSGTGIGLAICKKIAELHHGTITAEGELGKGCIIHVALPVHKVDNMLRDSGLVAILDTNAESV